MVLDDEGHDPKGHETLGSPPSVLSLNKAWQFPPLPFDLIAEILCRLPVKFLLQFRCICKSWNSLISDSKFVKKHLLHLSTSFNLHSLRFSASLSKYTLMSFPLDSLSPHVTELEFPNNFDGKYHRLRPPHNIFGSCNGIIYLAHCLDCCFVSMWNPSVRKFKELPPFQKPQGVSHINMTHGFGYDRVNDNYKAVVVLKYYVGVLSKTEVKVHILGTKFWKSINDSFLSVVLLVTFRENL